MTNEKKLIIAVVILSLTVASILVYLWSVKSSFYLRTVPVSSISPTSADSQLPVKNSITATVGDVSLDKVTVSDESGKTYSIFISQNTKVYTTVNSKNVETSSSSVIRKGNTPDLAILSSVDEIKKGNSVNVITDENISEKTEFIAKQIYILK